MQATIQSLMQAEDPHTPLVTTSGGQHMRHTMYTLSRQMTKNSVKSGSQTKLFVAPTTSESSLTLTSAYQKNAMLNVGQRLARRRQMFKRGRVVCDFALAFALLGVALMVVETECTLLGVYSKTDFASYIVKTAISASTIALLAFDIWYHVLETQITMVDNALDDWRLTVGIRRVALIGVELLVYAVHPIPGAYYVTATTNEAYLTMTSMKTVVIPIDIFLSMPMVLRVHLIARAVMLHSQLYTNASSQSLGALNRIRFNIKFVFKSFMDLHPGLFVFTMSFSVFVLASWLMWACEVTHYNSQATLLNACWIIAITFLTIGYGDLVPISSCGRAVSVLTGLLGAGCTALIVALLTRMLQLSRAERYVHDFVIDIQREKKRKLVAVNMVKYCWRAHKCRAAGEVALARRYERSMFVAVQTMRDIRLSRRSVIDRTVTLAEVNKLQGTTHDSIVRVESVQRDLDGRVAVVEMRLTSLDSKMDTLRDLLLSSR